MTFKLPLYRQAKDNTCALACLRMVLAASGTHVEESVLEGRSPQNPPPLSAGVRRARRILRDLFQAGGYLANSER
jgi:hypothetical protein